MTAEELGKNLQKTVTAIENGLAELMVVVGMDALQLMRLRIQKTGTNAKGEKFKPYSTKPMLVGDKSFKKKDSSRFFNKQDLKWVSIRRDHSKEKLPKGKHLQKGDYWRLAQLQGGYKELREIALGAGHGDIVDFSFTNDMWNNISIISDKSDHAKGKVIIGPQQDQEQKKLAGNVEKRGDILDLNQSEIDTLSGTFNERLRKIFKDSGL